MAIPVPLPKTAAGIAIAAEVEAKIVAEYRSAWLEIERELKAIRARVATARLTGQEINRDWLRREARLQDFEQQVAARIRGIERSATAAITNGQARAINGAQRDAHELIHAALPGFHTKLPVGAFERLVGTSYYRNKPLAALLAKLPEEAGRAVRTKLATGLLLGRHPSSVARDMRSALGGNMSRARTIARTEIMRAYRETSIATYQANRDVVSGWIWQAEIDACPECAAKDGKEFPVDELMLSHPSCRCAPSPTTKSVADVGAGRLGATPIRGAEEEIGSSVIGNVALAGVNEKAARSAISGVERVLAPQGLKLEALVAGEGGAETGMAGAIWKSGAGRPGKRDPGRIIVRKDLLDHQAARQRADDLLANWRRDASERLLSRTNRYAVWQDAADPIETILAHEAAHELFHQKVGAKVWGAALRAEKVTLEERLLVSEYGASDPTELFCEAIALRVSGRDVPASIATALVRVLGG